MVKYNNSMIDFILFFYKLYSILSIFLTVLLMVEIMVSPHQRVHPWAWQPPEVNPETEVNLLQGQAGMKISLPVKPEMGVKPETEDKKYLPIMLRFPRWEAKDFPIPPLWEFPKIQGVITVLLDPQ